MFNFRKNTAFTLAEVLITLSIIGVVAAMTIPTLITNYRESVWATTLKKTYSTATTVCERMLAEENTSRFHETKFAAEMNKTSPNANTVKSILNQYFKIKDGTLESNHPLLSKPVYTFTTPEGSKLSIGSGCLGLNCISGMNIAVDVNGSDAPNVVGRDIFAFELDDHCQYTDFSNSSDGHQAFKDAMDDNWQL